MKDICKKCRHMQPGVSYEWWCSFRLFNQRFCKHEEHKDKLEDLFDPIDKSDKSE